MHMRRNAKEGCPVKRHPHIRAMIRRLLASFFCALVLTLVVGGAEAPISAYDQVTIAPTKTSIYIGTVSMTMPAFVRKNGIYESTYVAKVFPYFFGSEKGVLAIKLSDAELRRLEKGEAVEFSGRAVNTDGEERRVEGKATPADVGGGKIKVRVFVSKRIELIFNTSYRFGEK